MARLHATNTKYQSWKPVPAKFKTICVPNKIKDKVMKTIKIIFCIAIWLVCLSKLSQGVHDEDLISQMPQSTYDEIVDTLTTRNGFQPTEHQIVTYYYERFQK